ncbi:MAG: hypothetical protein ACOYZ6_08110 [Chloroflexota bacterium]
MQSRIVHPRMMEYLRRDFFTQSCALKQPTKAQDTTGAETVAHDVKPGYEVIPCRVGAAGGGERRGNNYTYLDATHRILLDGQFQDVTEEWIAEVDGQEYQILLVAKDAEGVMTRLECRIVR